MNFRDFHQMSTNHEFSLNQRIDKTKVRVEIDGHAITPIYIHLSEGIYIEHNNDVFRDMYYLKEEISNVRNVIQGMILEEFMIWNLFSQENLIWEKVIYNYK